MIRLKKYLIFFLLAYMFIFVSRMRSITSSNSLIQQLKMAIVSQDLSKQIDLLKSIDNFEFKKLLEKVFKGNQNELFDYITQLDDSQFLKKYFDVKKLSEIDIKLLLSLLGKAFSAGSLQMVADLIEKANVKPTTEMIVLNFDSIARETDEGKIKNFVGTIKKAGFLKTILEVRNILDQDKDLTALIHHVANYCNIDWLKVLVEQGVNGNLENLVQNTPLHVAVITLFPGTLDNKVEFIDFLIKETGITSLYKNKDNKTPFDLAKEYLAKYQELYRQATALEFKGLMKKKVEVYQQLVEILSKISEAGI